MHKMNQKVVAIALSALITGGSLISLPSNVKAASLSQGSAVTQSLTSYFNGTVKEAIDQLVSQQVLVGYKDGSMQEDKVVTNAEFLKMVVLTLQVAQNDTNNNQAKDEAWYSAYLDAAVTAGMLGSKENYAANAALSKQDAITLIAKALQRDLKSIEYWMSGLDITTDTITRGQAAELLVLSQKAVRSADAKIVSIKALNKISFEVTFDAPLTIVDETTDQANANFAFDHNLKLVNQPRLKTGAIATYIVPVQTMTADTTYTTNYKGQETYSVKSSEELLQLGEARQVTNDTFEIVSFQSKGVIDYGYLISAYANGRGANAVVLDENNKLNGMDMQIIPSLATRGAILTPEGGEPIVVNYVGYTQSTDGKQQPKFRIPNGGTLEAGKKYTVTSDWFTVEQNTFVAKEITPLEIASAEKVNETTIHIALSADPEDELFAYRSVSLKGSDGSTLTAQYVVQTRKGSVGVFQLQNEDKLVDGVIYEITPVGGWATTAGKIELN